MESQPNDLQRSIHEYDSSSALVVVQQQQIVPPAPSQLELVPNPLRMLILRFLNLPMAAKIGLIGGGVIFGFALFQAVLKLIASIIGVTLLLGLVYLGYKFFVSDTGQNQQGQQ